MLLVHAGSVNVRGVDKLLLVLEVDLLAPRPNQVLSPPNPCARVVTAVGRARVVADPFHKDQPAAAEVEDMIAEVLCAEVPVDLEPLGPARPVRLIRDVGRNDVPLATQRVGQLGPRGLDA